MFGRIAVEPAKNPLPYTAQLPCLLRGSFYRLRTCDPSFYAIGKIVKNGWRNQFNIDMPNEWNEYLSARPVPTRFGFRYSGPFFVRCDHGCSHTNVSHATAACSDWEFRAQDVFRISERQLQQSGFVFVWAGIGEDSLQTAYGSLVEIGIAHALKKPILLVHHPEANLRDFWFAVEAASAVICAEKPLDALAMLRTERSR
jgi:hypothetical protein